MFLQNNGTGLRATYTNLFDTTEPALREQLTFSEYKKIAPISKFYLVGIESHLFAGAITGAGVGAAAGGAVGMCATPIGGAAGAAVFGTGGGFLGGLGGIALGVINTTGFMLTDYKGWKEQNTFNAYRTEIMNILFEDKELAEFRCPISLTLMWDPVSVYTNGGKNKHTFNRPEIEAWIEEKGTNPNTDEAITKNDLFKDAEYHKRQYLVLCRVIERHLIQIPIEMTSIIKTLNGIGIMYSKHHQEKNPDMVGASDISKVFRLPTSAIHYEKTV